MNEDNKLVVTGDKASIIDKVKRISGEQTQNPRPMCINFDAKSGIFSREIDEKDEGTGYNKWEEIGEMLMFQMLTTTKGYKPEFNSTEGFYSDEFMGGLITVYGKDRDVIWQGSGKDLKNDPIKDHLTFVQNIYICAKIGEGEAEIYKFKLSGSNLTTWFPYLESFGKDDSSTFYVTTASRGRRMKGLGKGQGNVDATPAEVETYDKNIKEGKGDRNKMNLYYLLNFEKGDEFPQEKVVERLNGIHEYLSYKELNKKVAEGANIKSKVDNRAVNIIPRPEPTEPEMDPIEAVKEKIIEGESPF